MDKIIELSVKIDALIKESSEIENELMSAVDLDYAALAVNAARRNGYMEVKSLIISL